MRFQNNTYRVRKRAVLMNNVQSSFLGVKEFSVFKMAKTNTELKSTSVVKKFY